MHRRIQLTCAWAGPMLVVLVGLGLTVFADLIPANGPHKSAADVVAHYADHSTGIRIGMVLVMFGGGLLVPWANALATQARRAAPGHPILFHIQVACSIGACMLLVIFSLVGGLASFRAGQIDENTTRTLNDLLWFCWVIPGSYFEVWSVVVGVSILLDKRAQPIFPRWSGYLSIFAAMTYLPGCLGFFFKDGPFAYNGLFVWWIPTVIFFAWIMPMSFLTIAAINREAQENPEGAPVISDPAVVAEFARLRAEIEHLRTSAPERVGAAAP